jgi:hypothetical protein
MQKKSQTRVMISIGWSAVSASTRATSSARSAASSIGSDTNRSPGSVRDISSTRSVAHRHAELVGTNWYRNPDRSTRRRTSR